MTEQKREIAVAASVIRLLPAESEIPASSPWSNSPARLLHEWSSGHGPKKFDWTQSATQDIPRTCRHTGRSYAPHPRIINLAIGLLPFWQVFLSPDLCMTALSRFCIGQGHGGPA